MFVPERKKNQFHVIFPLFLQGAVHFKIVKYERIKFLVIALRESIEIYAWAPKPYHKFMAFKVSFFTISRNFHENSRFFFRFCSHSASSNTSLFWLISPLKKARVSKSCTGQPRASMPWTWTAPLFTIFIRQSTPRGLLYPIP